MGNDICIPAYDLVGNLWSAFNAVTNTYAANCLNQYTAAGSVSPVYDADGNMRWDGRMWHAWDAENRLVHSEPGWDGSTNGARRVVNRYDHMSRLVETRVEMLSGRGAGYPFDPSQAGTWDVVEARTFIYDGWLPVLEKITRTGGVIETREHVWGKDLSGTRGGAGGVGGLLATRINDAWYFPLYDNNGNVTDYIDASGATVAHREYGPFGETLAASGPMADAFNFWFSTKYLHHETGFYYYGYRFYSPELMRWLNRDPIEERGGLNLYGLTGNEPVNTIDSLGLESYSIFYGTGPADGIASIAVAAEQVRMYLAKFQPADDKNENMICKLKVEDGISSSRLRWASTVYNELFFFGHGRKNTRINPNWKPGQPLKEREQVLGTNIMFSDGLFHLDKVLTESKEKITASIIYPYVCYDAFVSEENPSGIKVCKLANNPNPNPSAVGNMTLIGLISEKFKAKKCCRLEIQ